MIFTYCISYFLKGPQESKRTRTGVINAAHVPTRKTLIMLMKQPAYSTCRVAHLNNSAAPSHHINPIWRIPHDHILLDRSPIIGPLISRWELDKFKNGWNKSFRTSKILTLLYQQFSNLLIFQRYMSGPRLGAPSNNRWSEGILRVIENQKNKRTSSNKEGHTKYTEPNWACNLSAWGQSDKLSKEDNPCLTRSFTNLFNLYKWHSVEKKKEKEEEEATC